MCGKKKFTLLLAIAIVSLCTIASAEAALNNKDQLEGNGQNSEENIALESGSLGSDTNGAIGADRVAVTNNVPINNQAVGIQASAVAATINSCTKISSSGTYTLSGDLLGITTSPCIVITSSDVTLDGAGHLLDGKKSGTAVDVYNPQTALTNVNIKNMRITNWSYAIRYRATVLSTLSNNQISTSSYGFYFDTYSGRNKFIGNNLTSNSNAFYIQTGYNNFTQNKLYSNSYGFYLYDSDYNVFNDNVGDGNNNAAFNLGYADNNTLNRNTATCIKSGNLCGTGFYLSGSTNNTLKGNKATQYYGFQLQSSSNNNLLDTNNVSNSGYGFYLGSSNYNTLMNSAVANTKYNGIYLSNSDNNTLMNGTVANTQYNGIYLYNSDNNTIRRNTIGGAPSNYYGMRLDSSNNSKIYDNIFNNTNNVQFYSGSTNTWNIAKKTATNIINGIYTAGNVWENPTKTGFSQICSDADRNGICDSAYPLSGANIDNLPLVHHPDSTIPKSVANLQNTSYASNYIRWTWTDPSDTDFSYVKVYINGAFRTGILKAVQAYNATGLLPNTSYTIGTRTVDINGNENATLKTHTAKTK